ncbi:MAG TPA: hypothetical protein PK572_07980, partial [Kiritimatiellia bacterium]|nr:hypothetical protein [Kiritimatiellia bacterium]
FFHSVEKMAQSCSIVWKSRVKVVPLRGKNWVIFPRCGKSRPRVMNFFPRCGKPLNPAPPQGGGGVRVQSSGFK